MKTKTDKLYLTSNKKIYIIYIHVLFYVSLLVIILYMYIYFVL